MFPGTSQNVWVGREEELAVLESAVQRIGAGTGTAVWIEGEAGIGKSALAVKGIEFARNAGYEVLTGIADPMAQRSPLHVVVDLLRISSRSADPRRTEIAKLLRERRLGLLEPTNVAWAEIELLVGLVDDMCTEGPIVLVVDDVQHFDEASLLLWHRLVSAVDQLPLLLLTTCRPTPPRQEVHDLRAAIARRGHFVLELAPLSDAESERLLAGLLAEVPDSTRDRLASLAMGNPLYLRELANATGLESGGADDRLPASFSEALTRRLGVVPDAATEVLRMAALLGGRFSVTELAVLMRRSASELAGALQDAVAAGIVMDVEGELTFRQPLLRQVLYQSIPGALRSALHREAAQALAISAGQPLRVAEQLAASDQIGDGWARQWLAVHAAPLAAQAPDLAIDLLRREVDQVQVDDDQTGVLLVVLAWVLLGVGRYREAAACARRGLAVVSTTGHRSEMEFVLVRALFSLGEHREGIDAVRRSLSRPDLPVVWRARLLGCLAMVQRGGEGDIAAADTTAQLALNMAESVHDSFAAAYALIVLWMNRSVRRDHGAALALLDRALDLLRTGPDHTDLRAMAEDGRIFTLQNLGRWEEAAAALHRKTGGVVQPGITTAVLRYWLGEWDDALAELDLDDASAAGFSYSGLREPGPLLLWHGVAALVAARRDERELSRKHLEAGLAVSGPTVADRENLDFLVVARAVVLEQDGDRARARAVLGEILLHRGSSEMTLTHQWLPDLVRLALDDGDEQTARAAVNACSVEASAEAEPGRAATALLRCQGLLTRDVNALAAAVSWYRETGPAVDLAAALEDLAVVLADRGEAAAARDAFNEAVDLYTGFGANWDVRRAERRLRAYGVRRGVRGKREPRVLSGWQALTSTELRIASMVADGQSTPSIAANLYLSPRTVQTHISHVLGKLGVRSRVEIAREVFRQRAGGAPVPS
ncbi:AAA family ATPase [Lentzea sp. DG1S-22]|uniref:ATP-binding protein n=1 Tax=Lentzea sp. DG1S-22 TaxID=3108822 RepID=UPI002E77A3A9|nr:AAA family ATPase [Lentzea sp. DG1S-22]WVH82386.1 AAA family ATPase [Lentzea sp. DG1S-22]